MLALTAVAFILGIWYCWIQLDLRKHWLNIPVWAIPQDFNADIKVAIIVPARNEAANILACLNSLLDQEYPRSLLEIYLIDDHSEDRTVELARSLKDDRLKIIALETMDLKTVSSPKKRALNIGISQTKATLILTTDADCVAKNNWVKIIVSYFKHEKMDLIAGPVCFEPYESSFEKFQALDFVGMMGITGAGIQSGQFHMCNGANMAFSKKSFEDIGGYGGMDQIASGDDILLAQKYVAHKELKIGFLKNTDAVITTKPQSNLSAFISQRLRWGAKSEHYKEKRIIWIQFAVLLTCLAIIAFAFLLLMFYKYHWQKYLTALFILLFFKIIGDYISLKTYAKFFRKTELLKSFFSGQWMHIIYIGIVGVLSVFVRKHEWKGRKLK